MVGAIVLDRFDQDQVAQLRPSKSVLQVGDAERNDVLSIKQMAVGTSDLSAGVATERGVVPGDGFNGIHRVWISETVKDIVGVELVHIDPFAGAGFFDRHLIGNKALARYSGDGLGVMKHGYRIERSSQHKHLPCTLHEALQR